VQAAFYTSTGARDAVMTSQRAEYDLTSQLMQAFGDVVVISVDGRRLSTPQLRYDRTVNQVASDSAFVASDMDGERRGIGFTADPGLNNLRILKSPSGTAGRINLRDLR
jgi:hypothetical protein